MCSNRGLKKGRARRSVIRRVLFSAIVLMLIVLICPMMAHAEAQTVEVGIPVEEHSELFIPRSMPTHGEGKIAVFLIDFPDYRNENPVATVEYYDRMYFNGGVSNNWDDISVADFYEQQSYGKLRLSGQVFDWYTAAHERSYYDDRKVELVTEVAEYYRAQGVDFSQFDGDNDGVIDAIVYHFAGETTSNRNTPWYPGLCMHWGGTIGDMTFKNMIQVDEFAVNTMTYGMSTICHELMHTLGMPDLYSEAAHIGYPVTDIMGGNANMINPYTKLLLGWIDNVKVITADADNVRLDVYSADNAGDVAIVTDEFNGIFDEFYLVAYQDLWGNSFPAIWHVDARLNEQGTAFKFENLYYNPRPDKENTHGSTYLSKYMFIEELSAHPAYNNVLEDSPLAGVMQFGADSVFGPNSFPSSDTHDGEYTGIRINNFTEHNDEYLTFDVAFVQDTASPEITTSQGDLEFVETITLRFNEYIYKGENWDDIQVTDMNGNPMNVSMLLPLYPRHEMEITFKESGYENGYKIIFPENSLRDSSGNGIKAVTLTPPVDRYIFPVREEQLPGVGEYKRDNTRAKYFPQEDSILVITSLWAKDPQTNQNIWGGKIEFMRLDYEGNVISQNIVDNPYSKGMAPYPFETADGNYIFFCHVTDATWANGIFCMDGNGNLKWVNNDYLNSHMDFRYEDCQIFVKEDGLLFLTYDRDSYDWKYAFVDSKTGQIEMAEVEGGGQKQNLYDYAGGELMDLGNGKLLYEHAVRSGNEYRVIWRIYNAETYALEMETEVPCTFDEDYWSKFAKGYDDGSILVYRENEQKGMMVMLNANLEMIKSIPLELKFNSYDAFTNNFWMEDDGFCEMIGTGGLGGDRTYQVRRYDRYLNLLWEANVYAEFVYFFTSPSGELMAYKSMLLPQRECYIEYYGVEHKHTHDGVYQERVAPSCREEGCAAHWYCKDCGTRFSDQGLTVIVDMQSLVLPKTGHTEKTLLASDPTCTETGLTEGKHCSVCHEVLVAQQTIPAKGHTEVIDRAKAADCTETGLTEGKHCSVCHEVLVAQQTIPAKGHSYDDKYDDTCNACGSVREAECAHSNTTPLSGKDSTCAETGLTVGEKCTKCGEILVAQQTIPAKGHTEVIDRAKAADCTETGLTEGKHCSVCHEVLVAQQTIPAKGHSYDDKYDDTCNTCGSVREAECAHSNTTPLPSKIPTCTEKGLTAGEKCSKCGEVLVEQQTLPALGHESLDIKAVAPTCTETGLSKGVECFVCNEILVAQQTIPAKGHTIVTDAAQDATCTETGLTEGEHCSDCNEILVAQQIVETKAHAEEIIPAVDATCTAAGSTAGTKCSTCGETVAAPQEIAPLEHTYTNECDADCDVCSTTRTPAEHAYGEWSVVTEATETTEGKQERTCTACGTVESQTIPMLTTVAGCTAAIGTPTSLCVVALLGALVWIRKKKD